MARRFRRGPGLLIALALIAVGGGAALTANASDGTAVAASSAGHQQVMAMSMAASTQTSGDDPDGDGYIMANPPVTGVTPSTYEPPHAYFHEFQAKCAPTHTAPDDPIVYPGQPGKSHDHTFMGNVSTNANSVTASLEAASGTTCLAPGDKSAYWMPSLFNGSQKILPVGPQTIYYKSSINDYTSVRPFPKGLRFVVGSPTQSQDEFKNLKGTVEGWECGTSYKNYNFPPTCPNTPDTQLNLRLQAPSCWDGIHLDTPDHKSHMAYPVAAWRQRERLPGRPPGGPADDRVQDGMAGQRQHVAGEPVQRGRLLLPLRLLRGLGHRDAVRHGRALHQRRPPVRRPRLRRVAGRQGRGARQQLPADPLKL